MLERSRSFLLMGALGCAALLWAGCSDPKKRAEEKQRAIEAARTAQSSAQEKKDAPAARPEVKLEQFWDDPSYGKLHADGPCPENIWALFSGNAPGEDAEEKKQNNARRAELALKLRDGTFLVKLRAPTGVKLLDYDAPKGQFPIELIGSIDCSDSFGNLTIAWAPAKAITPGASAAKQGAEVSQNIWVAEPLKYAMPMRTQAEAKEFTEKRRFDLTARLVLKLGKVEVDKKMFKTTKVSQGDLSLGGGMEDWGAGRLVRAEIQGLRLATEFEKTPIIETRGKQ